MKINKSLIKNIAFIKSSNIQSIKDNQLTSLTKESQVNPKQTETQANNYKINNLNNGHVVNMNSTEQQSHMNGSSNTIRNLLAQQSSHSIDSCPSSIQAASNIRPSGGKTKYYDASKLIQTT